MAAGQTIGSLIVELRANSAQFSAEMDNARKGLKNVGEHAAGSGRQLSRFAAIAVQELVPSLNGSRVALEQIIQRVPQATAALGTVAGAATAAAFAAVGIAAIGVGTALAHLGGQRTWIDNWREAGQVSEGFIDRLKLTIGLVGDYEERIKKASEEEKAFHDKLAAVGDQRLALAKELNSAQGAAAVSGFQLTGDTEGAARAELQTRLRDIALEIDARRSAFFKLTTDADVRREFEAQQERIAVQKRVQAHNEATKKIQDDEKARADKYIKGLQDETEKLASELDKRAQFWKQFDAQLGTGATGLGLGRTTVDALAQARRLAVQQGLAAQQVASSSPFQSSAGLSPFATVTGADVAAVRALQQAWDDARDSVDAYNKTLRERPNATQGFIAVKELQDKIRTATEDLARDEQQGRISPRDTLDEQERIRQGAIDAADAIKDRWGHIPAVLDAVNRAFTSIRFGNLGSEMEKARQFIAANVQATEAARGKTVELIGQLNSLPTAAEQSKTAVDKLTQSYRDMADALAAVNQQEAIFQGGGQPAQTTPTNTGSSDVRVIDEVSNQ